MNIIAHINTDFPEKFGIPRQSGLIEELRGRVIFEPEYRDPQAVRELETFSHIWLIWEFSEAKRETWSPTVRPPRLGGNKRVGVFASRSPFRPNPIGLSSVKLESIEYHKELGPVLHISGADLLDGTPIFDIKPYLPFTDSHPDAKGGYAQERAAYHLHVVFPQKWLDKIPAAQQNALKAVLAHDPRPSYQNDPDRIYGFPFGENEIKFTVKDGQLTVCSVTAGNISPKHGV